MVEFNQFKIGNYDLDKKDDILLIFSEKDSFLQ